MLPAERDGQGYHWSRWPLILGVILALGGVWSAGDSSGAWPKHKAPATVAQQPVMRKAAPEEDASADAQKNAISSCSEVIAAVISSSVTLATSDIGPLENNENRKAIGDMLVGCSKTCLAVTTVATVASAGAATEHVSMAISAFNDDSPTTQELSDKMNVPF